MHARKLFLASSVLLVIGLFSIGSKWDGSAGINAGDSLSAWAVTFNGSVHGLPALIGVISVIAALLVFLAALINWAMASSKS
ncbi:MAG: hypothetical protein WAN69_15840 [Candidatus Korobacteraceae bacterium]|jgi:hypothetical protein